jgi:hypothetical protein
MMIVRWCGERVADIFYLALCDGWGLRNELAASQPIEIKWSCVDAERWLPAARQRFPSFSFLLDR